MSGADDGSGASGTALTPAPMRDLAPAPPTPLQRFFSNITAVAALYKTDATWKLPAAVGAATDTTTLQAYIPADTTGTSGSDPVCVHFSPTVLLLSGSVATDQPYWNPETIGIPADWTRSILIISITTGGTTEDNRQAHAFRVTNTDQLLVEYLGPFGGATSSKLSNGSSSSDDDNPKSALGTPPPPVIGQKAPDDVLVQTSFSLVNTLTQRTMNPLSVSLSPSGSITSKSTTDQGTDSHPLLTFSGGLQLQFNLPYRTSQLTPPQPTFVASCNVVLKKLPPTFLVVSLSFTVPFDKEGKVVIDHDADVTQLNDHINGPNGLGQIILDGETKVDLRPAIRQGLIPIHLTGYASDTGPVGNNVKLAGQRCDAVRVLLAGANSGTGNGTQGGLLGDGQILFQMLALGSLNPPATSVSEGRFVEIRFDGQEMLDGFARSRGTKF